MSKIEIRAVGDVSFSMDGNKPRIDARAIKYNSWSVDLGGFRERVMPDAIILDADLVALFDHATDKVLGRVSAGTMDVRQDSAGVAFTAYMPDTTWANDLRVSMMRGDIKGCSFRMMVDEDKWYTDGGEVRRDILKARVSELTVTSMPAYPETSAEARSTAEQLAKATESRAGRVLSGANEIALKAALEAIDLAETTLEAVLAQIDPTFVPESEDGMDSCDCCDGEGCTGCSCTSEMIDTNCTCPDAECATCHPQDSEMAGGSPDESRHSVGATENTQTRSAFTRFGFISTKKEGS